MERKISLLDFSNLGESKIFVDKLGISKIHEDDGTYLREVLRQGKRTEKTSLLAETTDFPLSKELKKRCFKVTLKYRDNSLCFGECTYKTKGIELINRGLSHWEPMDFSCSWIESDVDDYILQIPNKKEYVIDLNMSLLNLSYVREKISLSEKVEFVLIGKNEVDSALQNSASQEQEDIDREFKFKMKNQVYLPSHNIEDPLILIFHKIDKIPLEWLSEFRNTTFTSTEHHLSDDVEYSISIGIYQGDETICQMVPYFYFNQKELNKEFNIEMGFPLHICELPRESYFRIILQARRISQGFVSKWILMESCEPINIGHGMCSIFDFQGSMRHNKFRVNLFSKNDESWYQPLYKESHDDCSIVLSLKGAFQDSTKSKSLSNKSQIVYYGDLPIDKDSPSRRMKLKERDWEKVCHGKASDTLVWKYRHLIRKKTPERVIELLKAVNWSDRHQISEIHHLLIDYPPVYPFVGFEILALDVCDIIIRKYAIKCLQSVSNKELQSVIPQLVQSLKREIYLSSDLTIFLLHRALNNKKVGHAFYWYLNSEMDDPLFKVRFGFLKRAYLENIDCKDRKDLFAVEKVLDKLIYVAKIAQKGISKKLLYDYLYEIHFPTKFHLPTSSSMVFCSLAVEKCRILNSNTRPLWLTFKTMNDQEVYVILKVGDDIRVDVLALQMMEILDQFWKKERMDLHLQPYIALPLKSCVGLIQVTSKSETLATINWKYGGNTFASAFSSTSLKAYLFKNNSQEKRDFAFRNFALSSAGYCVFTYVFGVGDRHGDNIMCTKKGNLFHIDFGYFLGERTRFLGFTRETNFFVLTQNYINAMDKYFDLFVEKSCKGFAIAQRYENVFTTLITLMIPCGEDVVTHDQLKYVKHALEPWLSEKEGKKKFLDMIFRSLKDKRTLINDFAHLIATRASE